MAILGLRGHPERYIPVAWVLRTGGGCGSLLPGTDNVRSADSLWVWQQGLALQGFIPLIQPYG